MTAPLRFTLTHLSGGRLSVRCAGAEATSERGLARLLVEADFPDRPVAAGRVGQTDWTFPSLHRFAAGGVSAAEADQAPERLHPALRAAVVALRAAKATAAVVVACLALAVFQPAHAAPPAGADPNSPAAAWFRSLRDTRGISCCDEADCRRTMIRPTSEGRIEAWIGKDEFGPDAPDEWHLIPEQEVRSRGDRPPGIRGAVVCFYAARVACADLEAGL